MQSTSWSQLVAALTVVVVFLAGCNSGSGKKETTRADTAKVDSPKAVSPKVDTPKAAIEKTATEQADYDAGYREAYDYGVEGLGGRPRFEGKSEAYKNGWRAGHKAGLAEFERNPPKKNVKRDKPE
jgi:hypothetical protein